MSSRKRIGEKLPIGRRAVLKVNLDRFAPRKSNSKRLIETKPCPIGMEIKFMFMRLQGGIRA